MLVAAICSLAKSNLPYLPEKRGKASDPKRKNKNKNKNKK
jgi:hypothetical protein